MSGRHIQQQLLERGEVVAAPSQRACHDQTFELPVGIYIAMASMFTGFVAVLSFAFRGGHMAVVYGVIFAFIAAFFAIPAVFPAMAGDSGRSRALSWFDFRDRGIAMATGHAPAREAAILVLLLPFLILCFGVAVATIATLV
jgi:hypothetical protein